MTRDQFAKLHTFLQVSEMTGYLDNELLGLIRELMTFFVQHGGIDSGTRELYVPEESLCQKCPENQDCPHVDNRLVCREYDKFIS